MAERKTRSNGRETMAKVLVHARRELDEVGPMKFNILRVIENSGVARSSLYHHFGGRDGVIAAVEVDRMASETMMINLALKGMIETVETREAALDAIRTVLVATGDSAGRRQRAHRIAVFATAQNIPLLSERLRENQLRGNQIMAETLKIAEERGLVSKVDNPDGVAHFVASLFMGRVTVDLLDDQSVDAAWIDTVMETIGSLLPAVN